MSSRPLALRNHPSLTSSNGSGSFLSLQPLEPNAQVDRTPASNSVLRRHDLPSSSLQAAATTLQGFDNTRIFDWLLVLRSLCPNRQQSTHSGMLSMHQLTALSALKDCQNEDIMVQLEACRREGDSTCQASFENASHRPQPALADFSADFGLASSPPMTGLDACNSGAATFYDRAETTDSTSRSSVSHANSFVDLVKSDRHGVGVTASGTGHQHWCTVCEHPPMTTCDGWKRHEKEMHEKGYMCMPRGPVEATELGLCCAFCGLPNPDQRHLEVHDAGLCAQKQAKHRRYTRKQGLVKHLKSHNVSEAWVLADRWKICLEKKYYACGFCVSIFFTNADRLNHIDSHHYRHFQHIADWDPNLIIRGLLLQPDVLASWQIVCPLHPDPRYTDLLWDRDGIAALQLRLELSEEPAHQLAADALFQSSGRHSQIPQKFSTPIGSFAIQHKVGGDEIPAGQQSHISRRVLSSYPSPTAQLRDGASSHLQACIPYWVAAENGRDHVLMPVHPPQSLDAFPFLEAADGYPSGALAHAAATTQASQDLSSTGAAAVPHFKEALGQRAVAPHESSQDNSSRYAHGSSPS